MERTGGFLGLSYLLVVPYCLRFGSFFVLSSVREGQSKGEMKLEVYTGCKKHPASQPPATEPSPPGHPHLPTAYEEFLVCPLCFSILGVIWLSRVGALWPSYTRFGIPLHLTSLRSKPDQLEIGSSVIEYTCVCVCVNTCVHACRGKRSILGDRVSVTDM